MVDYSFLRLKDNLSDALNIGDSPVATHFDFSPIQLLPDKTYLQITNFQDGISLDSDCEVFVVDCKDNVLADITDNVFIEEFVKQSDGTNQCKIEYVNLNVDFYKQTVLIKFDMLSSDAVFYTNPINITSYQSNRTVFFKYRNYDDFSGIGYTNANVWQSISLNLYFDIPLDETETEDYFQISRENTISARALEKIFEQYKIEKINRFTFERLNKLFKHELIYLDDVRVTNKPVVSSSEREGDSNWFETDVIVAKNYNDVSPYEFQIFEGLKYVKFNPSGYYVSGVFFIVFFVDFNVPIELNSGSFSLYNGSNTLITTFDISSSNSSISNQKRLLIDVNSDPIFQSLPDDNYYVTLTANTVNYNGIGNEAINDSNTWTFIISQPDFLVTDFNNNDFFT